MPAELTALFGRRQQIAQARAMLADRRLLTLTGIGGVGKTRLALRIASSLQRRFQEGGVWLVQLGSLREPALVARAVADVLRVPDLGRMSLVDRMGDWLGNARTLLLIDNCEHLLDAAADLAERMLGACPRLHVLTTSRQALGVGGEAVIVVQPLAIDDARQLFLERAAAACGYTPVAADQAKIDRLCDRLDRLPLALELAARRLKTVSIADMTARIDSGFGLQGLGTRRGEARQQTLRATLDWSHDLLDAPERLAWRRLAFLESSFRLPTAEALLGGDALELVAALVDRSILTVELRSDQTWYRMLETLRRYGQERLEASGERPDMERRMVTFYLRLAEDADRRQSGPDQVPGWAEVLDDEQGNLRRALAVAGRLSGDHQLRMATALVAYWDLRGHLDEGRRWLEGALARRPAVLDPTLEGLTLDGTGWLAFRQNDYATAESFFERARVVAEAASDARVLARADSNLGLLRIVTGRTDDAERYLRSGIQTSREAGMPEEEIRPLLMLAMLSYVAGDLAAAVRDAQSCLKVAREVGSLKNSAMAIATLGNLYVELGDAAAARGCLDEAVAIMDRLGDRVDMVLILGACARLADLEHDPERCIQLAAAAAQLARVTGAGAVSAWQWRVDEAVARARAALGRARADAIWDRGSQLDPGEAVLVARGQTVEAPGRRNRPDIEGVLTKRELEVAALVADGLSNRGISDRLIIGQRTVETHVQNILNKLGFQSRSEIAAWAARRRPELR